MKKENIVQEKMINKRQLERLIIIHNAIKAGLYPNNKTLRQLYCEQTGYKNVSEATIQRDIDTLRVNFHAPIEYDTFKKGYYLLDSNYDFALNNISHTSHMKKLREALQNIEKTATKCLRPHILRLSGNTGGVS